ncbi:MAG: hypothetical protein J0I23_31175 [Rhizobiales bacterium]|nr:hypothetical protein [Hyphomicrobiales bacterium]
MKKLTIAEFQSELKAQGVDRREDMAVVCPICKTVQSMQSLINAGAKDQDHAERLTGFSCVGRFTGAGPHKKGTPPGKGCDWTLGGLFRLHEMVVIDENGREHPHFLPATPEQARKLASQNGGFNG